ncbi:MAG: hypothetical protein K2X74_02775, partial [Acetobacteraceae bacterium]|nr:hypothetical protein [Acetobacteraceae bacterium]
RIAGSANSDFGLVTGQALEVGSVLTSNGITAGAAGVVGLRASAGDITQSQAIAGGRLRVVASAGEANLTSVTNQVGVVAANVSTNFGLLNSGALRVDSVTAFGATTDGIATGGGAGIVNLETSGNLTQAGGAAGAILASRVRAVSTSGSVALDSSFNQIGRAAGSGGTGFALSTSVSLTVGSVLGTDNISGGTGDVALTVGFGTGITTLASGAITAGTGRQVTLRADDLDIGARISAPGGEINLRPSAGSLPGFVLGSNAGAGIVLSGTELGLLGDVGSPTARLRVTAPGGVTLAGNVALRGRVDTLELGGGVGVNGVTQSAGTLDVGRLVVRMPGNVQVDRTGNVIDEVAVRTTGGTSVSVASSGSALLTVVNDATSGTNGIAGSPALATITLAGQALTLNAPVQATGLVTLSADGAVTQGAGSTLQAGTLTVQGLTGANAASISLAQAGNQITTLNNVTAAGSIAIRSDVAGNFTVGDVISTNGDVTLTLGNAAGTLVMTTGQARADNGTATVIADAFNFGALGVRVQGRDVGIGPFSALNVLVDGVGPVPGALVIDQTVLDRLSATQSLTIGSASSGDVTFIQPRNFGLIAPRLNVIAGGAVTQGLFDAIQIPTLNVVAGGAVTLDLAFNQVNTIGGSAGGRFALFNGGALAVSGITATGAVDLTAQTGTITQTGAISGTALTATANGAGGAVTLTNAANSVTSVGGGATGGFAFAEANGFGVSGITA